MKARIAFAGMRHGHIIGLYNYLKTRDDVQVVAAAENDVAAAGGIMKDVKITHTSIDALFADADTFDIVAVGDYYAARGPIAVRALAAGKHVISDKPICTDLRELDAIRRYSTSGLRIGCQLYMRDSATMRTVKKVIDERVIGAVHTVNFTGQHPLLYGTRPGWYFEQGKHGGTINDIAVHAIDAIPWILGVPFDECIAARVWNAGCPEVKHFETGAQMMLRLADGCGVLGDVSYFAPDSQGYTMPQYWRITFHGEKGVIETSQTAADVTLWLHGEKTHRKIPLTAERPGGIVDDFLQEINGTPRPNGLTTEAVLTAAYTALSIQSAAVDKRSHVQIKYPGSTRK